MENKKELRQRVIALLTQEQIEFLDKLGNDSRFSEGKKLTHTKIISYLVDILMELQIDGKAIKTAHDLHEKIKKALYRNILTADIGNIEKQNIINIKEELKKLDQLEFAVNHQKGEQK